MKFLLALLNLIFFALLDGYAIMKMWEWFVPRAIPTLGPISLATAIGIDYLIALFIPPAASVWINYQIGDDDETAMVKRNTTRIMHAARTLIVLAVGWIVKTYA